MRLYKLKAFARFQRRERIADQVLGRAVKSAEEGLVDADLGGGLIKQRVARQSQGKSGGFRTLIAYRRGDRAIFLFGFAENERDNLDADELVYWRGVGRAYLGLGDERIEAAIAAGELNEVSYDEDE